MAAKSFFTASMGASLLTFAVTANANIFARDDYPAQPPCSYPYTSFLYTGCYVDASLPRPLNYDPHLDITNMTVQLCTASCKGENIVFFPTLSGIDAYNI